MFELLLVARTGHGAQLSYLGGAGVEGGQGSNDYNYGALLGGNALSARLVAGFARKCHQHAGLCCLLLQRQGGATLVAARAAAVSAYI